MLNEYPLRRSIIDGRIVVDFYCDVIDCELARSGVRRGAATPAAAESSACGRGHAVGLTSIFNPGQFFSSDVNV